MMENHNRNHVDPLTYRGRQGVHTRARSHRQYEASGLSAYMGFDMWWRWVSHHVPFPDDIWLTLPDGQRALLIIYGHPYPIIYEEIVDDGVDETINSVDDVSDDDDDDDDNSSDDIEWARCDGDDCIITGFFATQCDCEGYFLITN